MVAISTNVTTAQRRKRTPKDALPKVFMLFSKTPEKNEDEEEKRGREVLREGRCERGKSIGEPGLQVKWIKRKLQLNQWKEKT